jgi:hypothetical protein
VEPLLDKEVQTCRSQRGVKAMAVKDCASVPGTLTRGERQPLVQADESEAVLDLDCEKARTLSATRDRQQRPDAPQVSRATSFVDA